MTQAKQLQIPAHQRDYSLDVIKILSCVLVVLMHSLRAFDKTVELHPILYYLTRCSMPLFFLAAGAVQLSKSEINSSYCFKKIKNILILMSAYYGLDFIIRVAIFRDFSFYGLVASAKGAYWDFGVFWFLQTMIIIYLILPWLHKGYKTHPIKLLVFFGSITLSLNAYNIINIQCYGADHYVDTAVRQPLRLWTWLFYYLLGGVIYKKYKLLNMSKIKVWSLAVITTVIAISFMYYMFFASTNIINGEYAYTSLTMMLWSCSLMIALLNVDFSKFKIAISRMAAMLIPVYAIHYTAIHRIVIPLDLFNGFWGQIAGYIAVLCITSIVAYVMTKIPFMKVFVKI